MKQGNPGVPPLSKYLKSDDLLTKLDKKAIKVGVDPKYISIAEYSAYNQDFVLCRDLVDEVRGKVEPNKDEEVFKFEDIYAGETSESKLKRIRSLYKEDFVLIVSDLSEVCWITNLRGRNMIPNCPLFFGYCIITKDNFILCADLNSSFSSLFKTVNYDKFEETLENEILKNLKENTKIILPSTTNYSIYEICLKYKSKEELSVVESPVSVMKAVKNKKEIAQMKESHILDAVSLCEFLEFMEETIPNKSLNEYEAATLLLKYRSQFKSFESNSFDAISAFGANGAIIHYKPKEDESTEIKTTNLYLLDSGGQYSIGGTTDITRTVHFGTPTEEHKKFFSLVLEGHSNLAATKFPKVTPGYKLGTIARRPLWQYEHVYNHGTGHGVGCFLNVHEFPPSVSKYKSREVDANILQPGNIISNEPGYYKVDHFGIRIENLVVVKELENNPNFCEFETISLVPIQQKLINTQYLSKEAINWINKYHEKCLDIVGSKLKELGKEKTYNWLVKNTTPILN